MLFGKKETTRNFTYDSKDKAKKNKLHLHYFHWTHFHVAFNIHPRINNSASRLDDLWSRSLRSIFHG
jgi:hypothetical protein